MFAKSVTAGAKRPSRWSISRRALEPWLLGLAGFSLTAAGLLVDRGAPAGTWTAAIIEQIAFTGVSE
jgi:hypothetical protein